MKKLTTIILSLILVLSLFPLGAYAAGSDPADPNVNILPILTDRTVTYHSSVEGVPDYVSFAFGRDSFADYFRADGWLYTKDGSALAGWALEEGGKVAFEPGDPIPDDMTGDIEVWAVWAPIVLSPDEIFTFNNSSYYFEDGREGYYMSEEDYNTMQLNLYKNFGLGPVPSPIISVVLATYPDWDWKGSCYGMSVVTALQHFGLLDAAKRQNVENLSEVEEDDAMISLINYYQSQAATSWLTENKAYVSGTPFYKTQIDSMYDKVAGGDMVLFTFYEGAAFTTPGHTILLTGAYERTDGSRVFIAYDNNCPWKYDGYEFSSRVIISPDGRTMTDPYGDPVGAFNWTADFRQFVSFNVDRSGSPLEWYKVFFAHIADIFRTIIRMFSTLA